MSDLLTRDAIVAAAPERKSIVLAVSEWGGSVRLVAPTPEEFCEWQEGQQRDRELGRPHRWKVRLAALCIADADGKRLLGDADVEALCRQSCAPIERVSAAALALCGIDSGNSESAEPAGA